MDSIERSIIVDTSATEAFSTWLRFENWPHFLKAIRTVRRLDDSKFQLFTERGGKEYESVVELSLVIPPTRIAWRTVSGVDKSGVVCFEALPDGRSKVSFKMKYFREAGWNHPHILAQRLESHLACFKKFVEN
ncbi:MAG: cyclase [Chthoniobacteraceae bacterium]|jgi:uncharacterized membrane protein|nr:cyclase [Chthoniobacteraceae bacterium]